MIVEDFHDEQTGAEIAIDDDGSVHVRGSSISANTFEEVAERFLDVMDCPEAHRVKEKLQSVAAEIAYDDDVSVIQQYHRPLILVDLEPDDHAPRYVKDYHLDGLTVRHFATDHDGGEHAIGDCLSHANDQRPCGERSDATRSSLDSSNGGFDAEPPYLTFELDEDAWGEGGDNS